jgi:ribonuclease VapC
MVLAGSRDVSPLRAQDYFDGLASQLELFEAPIDERVGRLAVECFERYGKGRHPAQLNFGDRLSYACAKAHGAALLFKGEDFARTDVDTR